MHPKAPIFVAIILLACEPPAVLADSPQCIVPVFGSKIDNPWHFIEISNKEMLISANNGLFIYNGKGITSVAGEGSKPLAELFDAPEGILIASGQGLFRYENGRVAAVPSNMPTGQINTIDSKDRQTLVGAAEGIFKFENARTVKITGEVTGAVFRIYRIGSRIVFVAARGLFYYENGSIKGIKKINADTTSSGEVLKTGKGLVWTTESGYAYYDGNNVSLIGVKVETIQDVEETTRGLLLGALNGVFLHERGRVLKVKGAETGAVHAFERTPSGLFIGAEKGLFLYDNGVIVLAKGDKTGSVQSFHKMPSGILIGAENGLFRNEGRIISRVPGDQVKNVDTIKATPSDILLSGDEGVFRFKEGVVSKVTGGQLNNYPRIFDTPRVVLISSDELYYYDNGRVKAIAGVNLERGLINEVWDTSHGVLVGAAEGLSLISYQGLSEAQIELRNAPELKQSHPIVDKNQFSGVVTHWTMTHSCAGAADYMGLQVVAKDKSGKNIATARAVGFNHSDGDLASFEATISVPSEGEVTFQVRASGELGEAVLGQPSAPILFDPVDGPRGIAEWIFAKWQYLIATPPLLVLLLNMVFFARARYSITAWRLMNDSYWGQAALAPLMMLIRHSRNAQLWLLDLYVQQRRKRLQRKPTLFLPMPLYGPDGASVSSDEVFSRFNRARHLWVQGSSGMGKTTIFLRLVDIYFGADKTTSFACFRRNGYILVPIEARRYPEVMSDDKGASAWVVGCVGSVLSESGLPFEDRSLLRAILSCGTLAVAIDGLNEAARSQAVAAFAREFPSTSVFVTSQEPGELPYENWSLPETIAQHVEGLLVLYLGEAKGIAIAKRLIDVGLMPHLQSGYDVRLVIDLATADPDCAMLPTDRTALYRSAVAAAWPKGDTRLEELQAAAWKIISERGPHEDKRQIKPVLDAPKDLLEKLEAVRERSERNIRLIRASPPGYEFVHDQMNAYLAASWLAERPTNSVIKDLLEVTKVWQDGIGTQRVLWTFVAEMLDRQRLEELWIFAGDDDRRAILGRALAERAEREGWALTRPGSRQPQHGE